MVRILGLSASPRKAATEFCVHKALEAAETIPGVETRYISIRGKKIGYCVHCDRCREGKECMIRDDVDEIIEQIVESDGLIIGSPVYTMTATPQLLAIFNRMRPLRKRMPDGFWGKVGGVIAVGGTRNGGQETTIATIVHCMLARGMTVVGGSTGYYSGAKVWTDNQDEQGARLDELGLKGVTDIGRRVAAQACQLKGIESIGNLGEYTCD